MQLPDGRRIDLLQHLSQRKLLRRTTVVLNSGDSTIEELVAVGPAACLILTSKKVRPEEILRVTHAAGPVVMPGGPLTAKVDAAAVRLRVELDADRIPEALADILRELQLLNVEVINKGAAAPTGSEPPQLTLVLRTAKTVASDSVLYPALLSQRKESPGLLASVQVDRGVISLRAVGGQGMTAVCRRSLDARRMVCLFQACQPSGGS